MRLQPTRTTYLLGPRAHGIVVRRGQNMTFGPPSYFCGLRWSVGPQPSAEERGRLEREVAAIGLLATRYVRTAAGWSVLAENEDGEQMPIILPHTQHTT